MRMFTQIPFQRRKDIDVNGFNKGGIAVQLVYCCGGATIELLLSIRPGTDRPDYTSATRNLLDRFAGKSEFVIRLAQSDLPFPWANLFYLGC